MTHESGFVATSTNCQRHILVELYPLNVGWAAFARYDGNGREERVEQLQPTELAPFAERAVGALLHDVPISSTLDRNNVLWSDSLRGEQRIRGRNQLLLGVGTRLRAGSVDTLVSSGGTGSVNERLRLFTPMALTAGYRGQFDSYGFDALAEVDLGTSKASVVNNPTGGHVDYNASAALSLHVLRYQAPRGLTSFYYGGGASFALHWFSVITPESNQYNTDRRQLLAGGGLDVDVLAGYEFMRASAVSLFLQGELNVPAYVINNEVSAGHLKTWFPGASLRLGAAF